MAERLVLVIILFALGYVIYHWAKHRQITQLTQRAAEAISDPVLRDLRPGVPAIVYFTMPTCAPCKTVQRPALAEMEREFGENLQIVTIDAAEHGDAAELWGVLTVPTTFILDERLATRDVNYGVADATKLRRQLAAL